MVKRSFLNQAALVGAVMAVTIATRASASTYNWVPTTTPNDWNATANWTSGDGVTFPQTAGDVANVNNNIPAATIVNLQQNASVGTLNVGDSDGLSGLTIAPGTVLTNTLTFDSGTSAAAQLNLGTLGTATNVISAPVVLNSNLNVNLGLAATATNNQSLTFSGGINTNGKVMTFTGGYCSTAPGTQIGFAVGADVSGNGTIVQNSTAQFAVHGTPNFATTAITPSSFTGTWAVNGYANNGNGNSASLVLHDGSLANAAEVAITGAHSNATTGTFDARQELGGFVQVGASPFFTTAVAPGNRLSTTKLSMSGGRLLLRGSSLSPTSPTTWITDTVATVNFKGGYSFIDINDQAQTGIAGVQLNAGSVVRGEGAAVYLRTPSDGSGYNTTGQFLAGNGSSFIVGQNGAVGSTTMGVVPWMLSQAGTASNYNNQLRFATYDPTRGFRQLANAEINAGALTANQNMRTATIALSSDLSINSLIVKTPVGTVSTLSGFTLTIQSGALALNDLNQAIGAAGAGTTAGTIAFGNREAMIFTMNGVNGGGTNNTDYLGVKLTGSGGLSKNGSGTLVLTGPNTITGNTHVGAGVLQVGDGTFTSAIGDGNVTVDGGALLDLRALSTAAAGSTIDYISDTKSLNLLQTGLFNGKVNISNGIETVGALTLGGVSQTGGYFGSTAAALANSSLSVNVNDAYFSGNGLVQIVPEPSTIMAGLTVTGLALMRRRRSC